MYSIMQRTLVDVRHMLINTEYINIICFNSNYKIETTFFLEFPSGNRFLEVRKIRSKYNPNVLICIIVLLFANCANILSLTIQEECFILSGSEALHTLRHTACDNSYPVIIISDDLSLWIICACYLYNNSVQIKIDFCWFRLRNIYTRTQ